VGTVIALEVVLGGGAIDRHLHDAVALLRGYREDEGTRYVRHVAEEVVRVAREYQVLGVGVVAISSNDVAQYPDDSPAWMAEVARAMGLTAPYLYDETQEVAKAYHAACTPDFFVFDADRKLVYRGQLDAARPGNGVPVSGYDLRAALDAVLANEPVPGPQLPSLGCNIKWKPGNEPDYFELGHVAARW
jgi:hypothetical protein